MAIINKKSIKEQLYEVLRARILNLTYPPGEKLVIDSLAKELSVSNTPLREAMAILERDGLLIVKPNTGIRVVSPEDGPVRDSVSAMYALCVGAYEVCRRERLEGPLIELMEERLPVQVKYMEMEGGGSEVEKGNDFAWAALNFDRSFPEATGNTNLIDMYDRISTLFIISSANLNQDMEHRREHLKEHEAILKAVKGGKAESVREQLTRHYHPRKA